MIDCTIVCASRGRPEAAHALLKSFLATQSSGRVEMRFAVDDTDPKAAEYPPGVTWILPSSSVTTAINLGAERVHTRYIGSLCDEQRFITNGWDAILLGALDEMGGGVVFPNDLINPGTMPACVLMSTAIVKAIGYFALPGLRYNYFDNVWKDLGLGLGKLRYFEDVAVQHLSQPQSFDNSPGIALDRADYFRWAQTQRAVDVGKARVALAAA